MSPIYFILRSNQLKEMYYSSQTDFFQFTLTHVVKNPEYVPAQVFTR